MARVRRYEIDFFVPVTKWLLGPKYEVSHTVWTLKNRNFAVFETAKFEERIEK
jgi:hypothetical protein